MNQSSAIFDRLMEIIRDRQQNPSDASYTSQLMNKGTAKICQKIAEESAEVIEAAHETGEGAGKHQVHEVADLLFHVWVLLAHLGHDLDDVRAELERRFGTSGLVEKASRTNKNQSSQDDRSSDS